MLQSDDRVVAAAVRLPLGGGRPRAVRILGWAGTAFFGAAALSAVFAPIISPADPIAQDLSQRFLPPFWLDGGTFSQPLGTDQLGRDTLSRLLHGARISLAISLSAVAISAVAGTTLGLMAGYAAASRRRLVRVIDRVVMSATEMALAIPGILLAIAVAAVFGTGLPVLILILSLFGWVVFARVVRGMLLGLHRRAFIEASVVLGARRIRLVVRHMLPHVLPQILVVAALQVGFMILVESALGYLGLSVDPPTPTWGNMVFEGRTIMQTSPWLAVFSGSAITLAVVSVNFMADLLRGRIASPTSTAGQGG